MNGDYVGIVHPWTYRRLLWWQTLTEGRHSFVWKVEKDQTYADYMGWGINARLD